MKNSTFSLAPLPDGSYAKAYRSGVAQPQEYINVDAAGGIYSTPADMAAFVRMFLNEGMAAGGTRVLSKESVEKMGVDQTVGTFNPVPNKGLAYGLGWDSVAEPGLGQAGVKGWTKNGGTFFYGAQILVAPDEGLAAVALGPAGGGYTPLAIVAARVDAGARGDRAGGVVPEAAPAAGGAGRRRARRADRVRRGRLRQLRSRLPAQGGGRRIAHHAHAATPTGSRPRPRRAPVSDRRLVHVGRGAADVVQRRERGREPVPGGTVAGRRQVLPGHPGVRAEADRPGRRRSRAPGAAGSESNGSW